MTAIKRAKTFSSIGMMVVITVVTSGCSTTGKLITEAIEQVKDLDYFLGNKELKDESAAPESTAAIPTDFNRVSLPNNANGQPSTDLSRACLSIPDPKFSYKKKVAFLGFEIDKPHQVVDLGAIHKDFPRYLAQRMNRQSFVVVDASHERSPSINRNFDIDTTSYIQHIAKKHNSQFVVTGIINDASRAHAKKTKLEKLKSFAPGTKIKKQRALEMTLTVFDGATGVIIDESQYSGSALDQLSMSGKPPAFSAQYREQHFGHLLDTYLSHQSSWLADTLTCLPMQANVTSVSGSSITFATGTESLIMPGDTLKLLRRIQLKHTLTGDPHYRFEENGEVVITQVYPNGALAQFSGGTPPYQVNQGDIVQAW